MAVLTQRATGIFASSVTIPNGAASEPTRLRQLRFAILEAVSSAKRVSSASSFDAARPVAGCRPATSKGKTMTETSRPIGCPPATSVFPGPAAARHRGVPAYDRAALRRPREVDQRARRGDARRQADPARDPEERRRRRSRSPQAIYDVGTLATVLQLLKLPDGTVKVLVEGRDRAPDRSATPTAQNISRPRPAVLAEPVGEAGRGRGAGALGRLRVRELREAQQEDLARRWSGAASQIDDYSKLADTVASHLADQDPREAGDPRADRRRRSGWRRCSASWRARSPCCRSRSASARASSARWRRRSASTTSTSR